MNFIKNFWFGNISLVISFWVVNLLVMQSLIFLTSFLALFFNFDGLFVFLLMLPYIIWSNVGTWRSSVNFKGNNIWSILAKIYIFVTLGLWLLRIARIFIL